MSVAHISTKRAEGLIASPVRQSVGLRVAQTLRKLLTRHTSGVLRRFPAYVNSGPRDQPARIEDQLHRPDLYLAEIESFHEKLASNGLLFEVGQSGVPFATMSMHRHALAKILAREVSSGTYQFHPARRSSVSIEGKRRDLYLFSPSDRIVHGVVAALLTAEVSPHLPAGVHSYQRGKGWWDGVDALSSFLRQHVKSRPIRERGMYVLRRDIRQYTDSIPVHDSAPIWNLLTDVLQRNRGGEDIPSITTSLLRRLIRPEIVESSCSPHGNSVAVTQNLRGIPTGSPITSALYNLCALPLDHALGSIHGGMYARYSDDFVFCHPDFKVARQAEETIRAVLNSLGLSANQDKGQNLYVTGAGRRSSEWPHAQPSTAFAFLGCRLSLNGEIFLKKKRARRVLRDLRRRAERTAEVVARQPMERRGYLICSALNQALNASSLFQQKSSRLLRLVVTDRNQLRHFDRLIELIVAETVTGVRGPRAFRSVSPRVIRSSWKLTSLFHERNRSK